MIQDTLTATCAQIRVEGFVRPGLLGLGTAQLGFLNYILSVKVFRDGHEREALRTTGTTVPLGGAVLLNIVRCHS